MAEQPGRLSAERLQRLELLAVTTERVRADDLADALADNRALRSTIAHLEAANDTLHGEVEALNRHIDQQAAADAPTLRAAAEYGAAWVGWQRSNREGNGPTNDYGLAVRTRDLAHEALIAALFPDPEDPPAPRRRWRVTDDDLKRIAELDAAPKVDLSDLAPEDPQKDATT